MDDIKLSSIIKEAEQSLKFFADDNFSQSNSFLLNKYSEEEIIEIFKLCLIKPSGKSWAPINQILLLLFQSAFSKNVNSESYRFLNLGNYIIHKLPIKIKPVIYSFGIGTDISFDLEATKKYDVPIYMYDPTPKVAEYMMRFNKEKNFIFTNEGIYSKEKKMKFYIPNYENKVNSSIYPIHGENSQYEIVQFRTLKDFMDHNNHKIIDILKMDIEGAALDVLQDMIENSRIRPKQIVTEFEVLNIENPLTYLPKIIKLMKSMTENNYTIFNQKLIRKASIELIFVHKTLMKNQSIKNRNVLFKYYNLIMNDIKIILDKYIKMLKKDIKKFLKNL